MSSSTISSPSCRVGPLVSVIVRDASDGAEVTGRFLVAVSIVSGGVVDGSLITRAQRALEGALTASAESRSHSRAEADFKVRLLMLVCECGTYYEDVQSLR